MIPHGMNQAECLMPALVHLYAMFALNTCLVVIYILSPRPYASQKKYFIFLSQVNTEKGIDV